MALGSTLPVTSPPPTSLVPISPMLTSRRHVDLLRTSSDLCPTR